MTPPAGPQPAPVPGEPDPAAVLALGEPPEPRHREELRRAAIGAAATVTGDPGGAARVADAVLAVCDEEAIRQMASELVSAARVRSLDFRNGVQMELEPARELVASWAAAARTILQDAGAPNYVEMLFGLAGDPQRYAFLLQRCGHLTPHEARLEAEGRAEAAEAESARLRAEIDRLRQQQSQ
jgi:hypothetical protein